MRKVGQNPAYLKLDSIGRLVYLADPAGIRLWVNQYFADGTVDISVANGNGESWRAVVDLPTAGRVVTGLSGERTSQLHAPSNVHTLSARTDQLIRTADEFCNSAVLQMIGAVEGVLCAHAAAVAVISHGVALPWPIFKCGGFVAGLIVEQLICTYVRNAAASASDPGRITTALLTEHTSPIPPPPDIPPTPGPAPEPVTLPTTMNRGDIYRITFRVNPAAWPAGFEPNVLVVHPGGNATCTGGEVSIDIFDGPTRLGGQSDAICGSNLLSGSQLQLGPIVAGTIDGRVDIRFLGTSATFESFWSLAVCRQSDPAPGSVLSCQGDTGISIESRIIIPRGS